MSIWTKCVGDFVLSKNSRFSVKESLCNLFRSHDLIIEKIKQQDIGDKLVKVNMEFSVDVDGFDFIHLMNEYFKELDKRNIQVEIHIDTILLN